MDILKSQMNFEGFIVGDWNGHGQIEGCEDSNCPDAFNSGVDIFMVPTEWEGLYWNTLEQVNSGEITIERLDDAVKRILKAKYHLGLLMKEFLMNLIKIFLAMNHTGISHVKLLENHWCF